MMDQAGHGQPWQQVGSGPSDLNVMPFEFQDFDVGTPPDLSGSLNSLDAHSSELQSSIERGTKLPYISDITFGLDKGSFLADCSNLDIIAGKLSNPTDGEMLSASVPALEFHSIDPQQTLNSHALEKCMVPSNYHQQAIGFATVNTVSEGPSVLYRDVLYSNDLDLTLDESGKIRGPMQISELALAWLALWVSQNAGRLPSIKELKALENLSHMPGKEIIAWLKQHVVVNSERFGNLLQQVDGKSSRRPRCFESRPRKIQSGEPKLFECTNRCGKTFSLHRKGDWARHERINFEAWACHYCTDVLTRKEHLQKHLKARHDVEEPDLKNRKRQVLDSSARPCGFCHKTFQTWELWLAHVAAHFEGSIGGRKWKMSQWKEPKSRAPGARKAPQQSSRYHGDGGDHDEEDDDQDGDGGDHDDDEDDDQDGDANGSANGGGGDGDNTGWSQCNSSYQLPHDPRGVDHGNGANSSFGSPNTLYNRRSGVTKPGEYSRIERPSRLHPAEDVAPMGNMRALVGRMAALDVSETGIEHASDSNVPALDDNSSSTHRERHVHQGLVGSGPITPRQVADMSQTGVLSMNEPKPKTSAKYLQLNEFRAPDIWHCHECQAGPYLYAITKSCLSVLKSGSQCGHNICDRCKKNDDHFPRKKAQNSSASSALASWLDGPYRQDAWNSLMSRASDARHVEKRSVELDKGLALVRGPKR